MVNELPQVLPRPLAEAWEKIAAGEMLGAREAREIVALGEERPDAVFALANAVRRLHFGDEVWLCSIINARSGRCAEDCAFCAQSARYRTKAPTFPMVKPEEIARAAQSAARAGAHGFSIVTSGRRPDEEVLARAVEGIRRVKEAGLYACASLGQITPEMARNLREAGLDRYHHNLETSERFFANICTTHTWAERLAAVRAAQEAGLDVCCGGIFGLGEGWDDRIDLALTLRELGVRSIPLNFLNPIPGTPLEGRALLRPREALLIISLFRLINPAAQIKVCGGREVTLGEFQSLMYFAGASGTMIGNYLTTAGRPPEEDLALIAELGLRPAKRRS